MVISHEMQADSSLKDGGKHQELLTKATGNGADPRLSKKVAKQHQEARQRRAL